MVESLAHGFLGFSLSQQTPLGSPLFLKGSYLWQVVRTRPAYPGGGGNLILFFLTSKIYDLTDG